MGPGRLLEQRGDLEARETSWSSGDASSRARGYFRDDRLVYIDEEVDQGEFGSTRDEYLLHDGQLIHFRRVGELPDLSDTDRPGFRDIELEILFDLDGRARVVRNLEDGIDRELDDTELQTIRSHFVIVRDRLLDEEA